MKLKFIFAFYVVFICIGIGCKGKTEVKEPGATPEASVQMPPEVAKQVLHSAIIRDTMNSAGYTYMEVEESGKKFWVAVPQTKVKVGDHVSFPDGSWMNQFQSKSLNKTFDKILFINNINLTSNVAVQGEATVASKPVMPFQPQNTLNIPKSKIIESPEPGSIEKVEGGYTLEELYSKKSELNGKIIKVRGKVVKVSPNIMKRNWIHIQDGTGQEGSNDITFTSVKEIAEIGSIVVAEGTLAVDKDFGAGYLYPAIVENSKFTK